MKPPHENFLRTPLPRHPSSLAHSCSPFNIKTRRCRECAILSLIKTKQLVLFLASYQITTGSLYECGAIRLHVCRIKLFNMLAGRYLRFQSLCKVSCQLSTVLLIAVLLFARRSSGVASLMCSLIQCQGLSEPGTRRRFDPCFILCVNTQ